MSQSDSSGAGRDRPRQRDAWAVPSSAMPFFSDGCFTSHGHDMRGSCAPGSEAALHKRSWLKEDGFASPVAQTCLLVPSPNDSPSCVFPTTVQTHQRGSTAVPRDFLTVHMQTLCSLLPKHLTEERPESTATSVSPGQSHRRWSGTPGRCAAGHRGASNVYLSLDLLF